MKEASEYAICYDISNDRERGRVEKILKGYGFRIQKSVFECKLSRGGKTGLIDALAKLELKTSSVKIYRIYGGTTSVVVGQPMVGPDDCFAYTL